MSITQVFLLAALYCCQSRLFFEPQSHVIPHPEKVEKGGQDAHLISQSMLIVADGVGGWAKYNVDPSKYSRALCSISQKMHKQKPLYFLENPNKLIQEAHRQNKNKGSSTMSVVTLVGSQLHSCHIGDCKLYVLRRYKEYRLIYQSQDQLHGFNFPFQLQAQMQDDSAQAICTKIQVRAGDLVILASDGMADNLFAYDVLKMAESARQTNKIRQVSMILAENAVKNANNSQIQTPFSMKAKEWGVLYKGGKPDDTTVVVAEIKGNQEN